MAIIPLPAGVRIRRIEWTLDRPAQINVSGYTGRRTVVANPWHGKWSARAELVPLIGEASVRGWRAFFASLKGQINTFRLPATEGAQNANAGVTVTSTAAQGAVSFAISGAATAMLAGQMVTVNDQLLQVTGVAGSVLTFEPPLRVQATAGTAVTTDRPYALMAMSSSTVGWSVDPGQLYGINFEAEEVIG